MTTAKNTPPRTDAAKAQLSDYVVWIGGILLAGILLSVIALKVSEIYNRETGPAEAPAPQLESAVSPDQTQIDSAASSESESEDDLTPNDINSNAELMVKGDAASAEAVMYAEQALTRYPPNPACADVVVYAASIIALKEKGFSKAEAGAYVVSDIHRKEPLDAEGMGKILDFVNRIYPRFSDYRTATDTILSECA